MRKSNKWAQGPVTLNVPPLPPDLIGSTGCRFESATFSLKIGVEVYLAVLETPECARAYANLRPFNLFRVQGLVRTSHGVVAFIVWTVAANSSRETKMEQFLNPHSGETVALVSALGQQTYLKVLIVDSSTSQVCDWYEFKNSFGFDKFCAAMALSIGHEAVGDFNEAVAELTSIYSTEDLLDL